MTNASSRGRASKQRAKHYEREVARIIGGKRHPADTGGQEDIEHPELCVQVKSGLRVANATIRDGLAAAQAAAITTGKLPALVLVDRSQARLRRFLVVDLQQWSAYYGYEGKGQEDDECDKS